MSDAVILGILALIPIVLTVLSGGISWLAVIVIKELKECSQDRIALHQSLGSLQAEVKECVADRLDLRQQLGVLREDVSFVNRHLEHTDKQVAVNKRDITSQAEETK